MESVQLGSLSSIQQTAFSGANRAIKQLDTNVQAIAAGDLSPSRIVDSKEQGALYTMNMQLLKMTDDMVGQVIDLIA